MTQPLLSIQKSLRKKLNQEGIVVLDPNTSRRAKRYLGNQDGAQEVDISGEERFAGRSAQTLVIHSKVKGGEFDGYFHGRTFDGLEEEVLVPPNKIETR